ncbi:MAG: hypothetical protein K2H11_02680, partial [Malacoplasma sp.]|nr:hypothetical protein [Malacoplasma sp.]
MLLSSFIFLISSLCEFIFSPSTVTLIPSSSHFFTFIPTYFSLALSLLIYNSPFYIDIYLHGNKTRH